jgi:hypothetical protein
VEAEPGTEAQADGEAPSRHPSGGFGGQPAAAGAPLERLTAERDALRTRLTEAEQLLAEMPSLRADREKLEVIRGSLGWRATAPLRRLMQAVRRQQLPAARLLIKRALLRLAARIRRRPPA